ncbi:hypothetical protein FB464_2736 [Subtercola boreus]|nr:hypothetical protein FB464_2736 [Subtercola boreus]
MPDVRCVFENCVEPVAKTIDLDREKDTLQCPVCSEHAHDIDWGVIPHDELVRNAEIRGLSRPLPEPGTDMSRARS